MNIPGNGVDGQGSQLIIAHSDRKKYLSSYFLTKPPNKTMLESEDARQLQYHGRPTIRQARQGPAAPRRTITVEDTGGDDGK
jgi:hypothetical protein